MPTLSLPACLPRRARLGLLLLAGAVAMRGETVALWLLDETTSGPGGILLADASPGRHSVSLPPGARLLPGRFGKALHRGGTAASAARPWEPVRSDRVTASRLNLGAHDWTIEGWLRLASETAGEGTLFEIGSRFPGDLRLVTRLSVAPAENAFILRHLSPVPPGGGLDESRVIELSDPGGPPSLRFERAETTWTLPGRPLERGRWMHVALVHVAVTRSARLFLDGRVRAVASLEMSALPSGGASHATLGIGGDGTHGFPGALDEIRVSDHAVYAAEFTPPGSLAMAASAKGDGAGTPSHPPVRASGAR